MNWFDRIRVFLGAFWTKLCTSVDFVEALECALGFIGRLTEARLANWEAGALVMTQPAAQSDIPNKISINKADIGPAFAPFSAVFAQNSQIALSTRDPRYGYICTLDITMPDIDLLVDHVLDPSLILIKDLDFQIRGNGDVLWFRKDPGNIEGIPIATITDPTTGTVSVKYELFGIKCRDSYIHQPVACFVSPLLNGFSEAAWRVHVEGATKYNAKKLLAEATNCVICDRDGRVATPAPWQEQGYGYVSVDGHIFRSAVRYTAEQFALACKVSLGQQVRRGDILFGNIGMYDWDEDPFPGVAEVPGILVNTDAGALWAPNRDKPVELYNGQNILPLEGFGSEDDLDIIDEYKRRCAALAEDSDVPHITIPDIVNPYKFIVQQLRKRRASTIILNADSLPQVDAAVQAVRDGTPVDAMVTVFIKETEESLLPIHITGFVTDTGMEGVAEYVSVTLTGEEATGEILL